MAFISFNATQVQPQASFDPIPAGKYICQIVESEIKSTKAGTGQQLVLTWEVLDGEFKGRKVWDRLNISNPNKGRTNQPGCTVCHLPRTGVLQLGQRTVAQQANAHPRQHQEEQKAMSRAMR